MSLFPLFSQPYTVENFGIGRGEAPVLCPLPYFYETMSSVDGYKYFIIFALRLFFSIHTTFSKSHNYKAAEQVVHVCRAFAGVHSQNYKRHPDLKNRGVCSVKKLSEIYCMTSSVLLFSLLPIFKYSELERYKETSTRSTSP
jgi:hypothetical protein